jgi:hypothetical protein
VEGNDVEVMRKVLLGHVQVQLLILKLLDEEGILPREKPIRLLEEYVTAADEADPDRLISLAATSILKLFRSGSEGNLAEVINLADFRNHPKID